MRNHRLIIELSYIEGHSINDGLEPKLCTMKHTFVVAVVATVLAHGTGTYLVKFDIESAYRMVPVHPINMPLLGIKWKENIYQGIHWGGQGWAIAPPPLNSGFSCAIIIL